MDAMKWRNRSFKRWKPSGWGVQVYTSAVSALNEVAVPVADSDGAFDTAPVWLAPFG